MSNSDYSENNINFYDLLPEVYQNSFSKSMFNTLFNRYVTKDELVHVDGYIGKGNVNANINRNIQEDSPDRQAAQLQPMLYSKVGTVEHMATWADVLNELEKVGVDTDTLKDWLTPQKFNWVPPIDIDKLLNYSDYYWVSPDNSVPQYITMKNDCHVLEAKISLYSRIIEDNGSTFQIVAIDDVENSFTVVGDYVGIFNVGTLFYVRNSVNVSIDNSFWTILESEYDSDNDLTILRVVEDVVDSTVSGEVSLEEFLALLRLETACMTGGVGFDTTLFDDNQLGSVLWNVELLSRISHSDLVSWVAEPNDPTLLVTDPGYNDLWYDISVDKLKQFSSSLAIVNGTTYIDEANWVVIVNNMSTVLSLTTGNNYFDLTGELIDIETNQWIEQNFWTHKSVIGNFVNAIQAQIPIIEYDSKLQLNEWVKKTHSWSYRVTNFDDFEITDKTPSLLELKELSEYKITPSRLEMIRGYGNLSDDIQSGSKIRITNSVGSVYIMSNITQGAGGTFTVLGDISSEYIAVGSPNPLSLPTFLKVRNSPSGSLDQDWNIASIDVSTPGISVITVAVTDIISTFSFGGAEIYQSNDGVYNVESSSFKKIKNSYSMVSFDINTNSVSIVGNIQDDIDFSNYFRHLSGTYEYSISSYDVLTDITVLVVKETLPVHFSVSSIFVDSFKTDIIVVEAFNCYDEITGAIVPVDTSNGDQWVGYDSHWLYNGISGVSPTSRRDSSIGVELKVPIQSVDSTYDIIYGSDDFTYKINDNVQHFLVNITPGISIFKLHTSLYGLAKESENDIRVYIKSDERYIRQYGNYEEIVVSGYVTGIAFNVLSPINSYSEVLIEVGVEDISDIGYSDILVRTEADNGIFATTPLTSTALIHLGEYKKSEQIKSDINQYPLFDMFDTDGISTKTVSEIFKYKESSDSDINFNINKRIVNNDNDYIFQQELLETDNSALFTYRNTSVVHSKYFVNSRTGIVYIWNNNTWNTTEVVGRRYLTPYISETVPSVDYNILSQVWYNPVSKVLKVYDGIVFVDEPYEATSVDPTLKSIWQPGTNNEVYTPKYIDGESNEVTVGDSSGAWELPEPLYYNVHHENRKEISLLYLTSHFSTIISEQSIVPGFSNTYGNTYHINTTPNFGLGGTIREYNDGLDLLLSSVFLDTSTTRKVISFAKNQYSSSIKSLTEFLVKDLVVSLSNTDPKTVEALYDIIIKETISKYELNDNNGLLYRDSPSHDGTNGVKNWIATSPMFSFSDKMKPFILDAEQNLIRHHDGHVSDNSMVDNVIMTAITTLLSTVDGRPNVGTLLGNTKIQYSIVKPQSEIDFNSSYNSLVISNGKYWYSSIDSSLYRMNLVDVGTVAPDVNNPENSKWYDIGTSTLYTLIASSWTITTAFGDGVIDSAWDKVQINDLNNQLILKVEEELYNVLDSNITQTLDYNNIENHSSYNNISNETFNEYSKSLEIQNPLSQAGLYVPANAFSWNYIKSVLVDSPYLGATLGSNIGGCWQDLYTKIFGTAFPHREPWILQGYDIKPDWWDLEYKETNGSRIWKYDHSTTTGMWDNIINGVIPVGYDLPSVSIPSYNYLPVMIADGVIGSYSPDDILPPFWDFESFFGISYSGPIRSLYSDYSLEIVTPNIDYKFGDIGTKEWLWMNSVDYLYDKLKIFHRIDPLSFYHGTFGIEYNTINSLQVNSDTHKVYSHTDTIFHGDISDDSVYKILGFNQWLTNYNRYFGIDYSAESFNKLWNSWKTPLVYQFGSFIDTESFNIENKNYDIVDSDLNITMKKSLGISESWIEALHVNVLKIPNTALSNSQPWVFDIGTVAARDIMYYDIKKYPVSQSNSVCRVYEFDILRLDSSENIITISGDWAHIFGTFTIVNSTYNDNIYTVDSVIYDGTANVTVITTLESFNDSVLDGMIISDYRTFDWVTGQEVIISSTRSLPSGFNKNQTYYVIKVNDFEFKLANTATDALNNNHIVFDSNYDGQLSVGEIYSTFSAISNSNTSETWLSYVLDKDYVLSFNSNKIVYGIQELVDIVLGYSDILDDAGWKPNHENTNIDQILGRTINWQLELEKCINELYIIQKDRQNIVDTFEFSSTVGGLSYSNSNPRWPIGTKVLVTSDSGLPSPLTEDTYYYVIPTSDNSFSLASSITDARNNNPINIVALTGGISYILRHIDKRVSYIFELNPFRDNIWYNNDKGIISNIFSGPYNDISVDNTIYNQAGKALTSKDINIFREDNISKISLITPGVTIDSSHISGFHIFSDGYEHIMIFENYSFEDFLIYDPYIGLNSVRFDMVFDRQSENTMRPNIGGKFLVNKTEFISNIESLTKNLEEAYSTYSSSEYDKMTDLSRVSLGYDKTEQLFLDNLQINDKSQFIFWKGLIQHKGSTTALNAFINSRRFVDAQVDEFWCYKIADFGDAKVKVKPELEINILDTVGNEVKFEFIKDLDIPEKNFTPISITDDTKWFEYYDQKKVLDDVYGSQFYFNSEITEIIENPVILQVNASYFFKSDIFFDTCNITHELNGIETSLVENTGYRIINSKVIEFIIYPLSYTNLTIRLMNVARSKHNPIKIIDYKSDITTLNLPLWNPSKGYHHHTTEHLIDIKNHNDPAKYTDFLPSGMAGNVLKPWDDSSKNLIWLDDSLLDYIPYHDERIIPNTVDRVRSWGKTADYAEIELYQWTESILNPSDYNIRASIEENDNTISEQIRLSGRVLESVYNVVEDKYEKSYKWYEEYHILDTQLTHTIETITFNSITQTEIDDYILNITPKFNIKGYTNGLLSAEVIFQHIINALDTTITVSISFSNISDEDLKTIIWFKYDVIDETGTRVYPTLEELDSGDYILDNPHVEIISKNEDFSDKITYYYWVKNKTIKINNSLSMVQLKNDMINMPIPYTIIQNPIIAEVSYPQNFIADINDPTFMVLVDSAGNIIPVSDLISSPLPSNWIVDPNDFSRMILTDGTGNYVPQQRVKGNILPYRYNQLIIKGLNNTISANDTYKLQFNNNYTLRDNVEDSLNSNISLKNTHTEWKLFRQNQTTHIDQFLWDRIIESVLGVTLDGKTRIPTLDRELFDIENNTSTRYGIGIGQSFIDSTLAKDAILKDLYNPVYDFYPVDIDTFVQTHDFDNIENSKKFLVDLYNNFSSENVNRIFFTLLHISFASKLKYENIMKTSMIALHGVKILEIEEE